MEFFKHKWGTASYLNTNNMKNKQTKSFLHSITTRDTVILIHSDREVSEEQILADEKGMYYMDGKIKSYLPKEFQPNHIFLTNSL